MGRLTIKSVQSAKPGRHSDGDGLYLLVKAPSNRAIERGERSGAKTWLLRVQVEGVRRDVGLGSVDTSAKAERDVVGSDIPLLQRRKLTLAEAREKAAMLRKAAMAGLDPIVERDKVRRSTPTFEEATKACHTDLQSSWSKRQADSFLSSLERHAYPALGKLKVDQIEAGHVRDMLEPIWGKYADMSRKVRTRVATVLNYAHSKGWRETEAPNKAVGMGLGKRAVSGNYAAMPYADVPRFVADTRAEVQTIGRLALLFTIHTAARSGETRKTRWAHIDFERKLWNRPADIMKGRVAHTVTLTDAAIAILEQAKLHRTPKPDGVIFPNTKGAALSDMTLSKIMRDADQPFTVHGFRSSFRDWAAEKMPTIPDAVAEAALAHVVSDAVVRAYKRTDFLNMRRRLLTGWSAHLDGDRAKKAQGGKRNG